jgi:ribonucleoside-diphosphate reductase alpha subunit
MNVIQENEESEHSTTITNKDVIRLITDDKSECVLTERMIINHLRFCIKESKLSLIDDIEQIASSVYSKLKNVNTMNDINDQIILYCSNYVSRHFDYDKLGIHLIINKLHSKTDDDYTIVLHKLYFNYRINRQKEKEHVPIISKEFYEYALKHVEEINKHLQYDRDYNYTIFGYKTLERSYLKKNYSKQIIERPQHMIMRIALAIHMNNLPYAFETYEYMSNFYFTHATPTLFNAGTDKQQLSSCYLLEMPDGLEEIFDGVKDCALISKYSGGIGIYINIRAKGSYIRSTQGDAFGIDIAHLLNQVSRLADQGGKRPGSFALYIEPWHPDILQFIDFKKNTGPETARARDLFFGLMINDIFMERVESDGIWSMFCPHDCPELPNAYGKEFSKLYLELESQNKYHSQMSARRLWFRILEAQIETGGPYLIFKDHVNLKSNQKNLGTIKCSNLCTEIMEYSSPNEYGVCNLASICLGKCVNVKNKSFDYELLHKITRIVVRNLDQIIDINYYPVNKTRVSNLKHRPIGVGVQGLADVFAMLKEPFDSVVARDINKKIFETIYHGCLTESIQLAREKGSYETFDGSPFSQGILQFDMWDGGVDKLSGMWDWDIIKKEIVKGIRNSLTTTVMPTASTSQIMGNNECIEPYTSNVYTRDTQAGSHIVINKHLMTNLMELNLWNQDMINKLIYYRGSIQKISEIPKNIKDIYRTNWEIPQKSIIEMSADRGVFIDQSQSLNIHIAKPDNVKLTSCHFYSWKLGLKTGMYYLRSKPASNPLPFALDISTIKLIESQEIKDNKENKENKEIKELETESYKPLVCVRRPKGINNNEPCLVCSS